MKSYDEIAKNVLKRRDEYEAKKKNDKKIVKRTVTSILFGTVAPILCIVVLVVCFKVWGKVFLSNEISATEDSDVNTSSESKYDKYYNSKYPFFTNPPDSSNSSGNNSQYPSYPQDKYSIDSIDKVNFYSAKKIISDNSLLPIGTSENGLTMPNVTMLGSKYAEYPIDKNKVFTITMVTYFKIELNNEKGFLAQKLGGTGLVEVVVTENNLEQLGRMITFKRNDKYYTCLMNNEEYNGSKKSYGFSSHKYIKGFNLVKNKEQENYRFTVHYDGTNVVGFDCEPFHSEPKKYVVDDVTLVEDYCIVFYTKQNFTIGQLESYYKNEEKDETL